MARNLEGLRLTASTQGHRRKRVAKPGEGLAQCNVSLTATELCEALRSSSRSVPCEALLACELVSREDLERRVALLAWAPGIKRRTEAARSVPNFQAPSQGTNLSLEAFSCSQAFS